MLRKITETTYHLRYVSIVDNIIEYYNNEIEVSYVLYSQSVSY